MNIHLTLLSLIFLITTALAGSLHNGLLYKHNITNPEPQKLPPDQVCISHESATYLLHLRDQLASFHDLLASPLNRTRTGEVTSVHKRDSKVDCSNLDIVGCLLHIVEYAAKSTDSRFIGSPEQPLTRLLGRVLDGLLGTIAPGVGTSLVQGVLAPLLSFLEGAIGGIGHALNK